MSSSSPGIDVNRMALDGLSQVMDSMDLVKRAWSGFSLATPFTPTLDVAELDKRISDLRAVEQWLSLNQNMLRSTIQGLEIQRGTLNAFSSVAESFGQAAAKPADGSLSQTFARFAAAAAQRSVVPPGAAEPAGEAEAAARAATGFDWSPMAMPSAAPFAAAAAATPSVAAAPSAATATEESGTGQAAQVAGVDPLGWWQMLQENFRQIAQAATAQAAPPDSVGPGTNRAAKSGSPKKRGGSAKSSSPKKPARAGKSGKAGKAGAALKGPQSRRGKPAIDGEQE